MLDFIIIGCQKCGTTMIKKNLKSLPSINIPNKELHFFDMKYGKGLEWYKKYFLNDNVINGEKTPNYITSELYIKRIKEHFPNIKLIIVFRNPILRALSHWNHFNQIYDEQSKNWGWNYYKTIFESIKFNKTILTNGHYFEQLSCVYKHFNRENILILSNENFRINSKDEFDKIRIFLNIAESKNIIINAHERKYENEVNLNEIKYLIHYYKDRIENLYNLLGYRYKEWDKFIFTFMNQNNSINYSINPKLNNVTCIITCVNYSDFLNITLPINKYIIPNIIILTSKNDKKTIEVCKKNNVNYIVSDIFFQKTKRNLCYRLLEKILCYRCVCKGYCKLSCVKNKYTVFQKSKAINLGIKEYCKTDWVLLLDADIIVSEKFKNIDFSKLNKDTLYGVSRIVYKTKNDWKNKVNAYYDFWKFMGFFQLFNLNSESFYNDYYGYNENYNYASEGDYYFSKKWTKKVLLDFYVTHLGETGENWHGRVTDFWD